MIIYEQIIEKTHELFVEIQNQENIQNGDVPPDLDLKLAEAQEQLAQIIDEIVQYQKSSLIERM